MTPAAETRKQACLDSGIQYLNFVAADVNGDLRSMEEDRSNFKKYFAHGLGVDGSSIPGYAKHASRSDVLMMADFEEETAFRPTIAVEDMSVVMCDVYGPEGKPHGGCPRSVLKRVLDMYKAKGWTSQMQTEIEFYLVHAGEDQKLVDQAGYMELPPADKGFGYRRKLAELLAGAGVSVRRIHHECGPSQNEIELNLRPSLESQDSTILSMWLTRMLAAQYGWDALLSPLPFGMGKAGNGLHQHIIVHDKDGKNIFFDEEKGQGLSKMGLSYIAGVLKYGKEITAVFARDQETFDRFNNKGHEAPVDLMWGAMNRSALVRIPAAHGSDIHMEFRAGDASGNTYLMAAALLLAGLKGVEDGLEAPAEGEVVGHLPLTADECEKLLVESPFINELLGDHMREYLIETMPGKEVKPLHG
ncbi:hypothetical protein KIPB_007414 [Kipferlia bialata]|uniref:Lengsin n=1 Tax=Kipferlia bialata TaxID=797122 RepID=A0A391NV12_9EUKA|nr:hypothetical protein KIPB_007414 [Kipferlia bialata]|eukprot:g7414.t1